MTLVAIPAPRNEPKPETCEQDPVRQRELTEIGQMLESAGWTRPQLRAMVSLNPIWGEVADLLDAQDGLR